MAVCCWAETCVLQVSCSETGAKEEVSLFSSDQDPDKETESAYPLVHLPEQLPSSSPVAASLFSASSASL